MQLSHCRSVCFCPFYTFVLLVLHFSVLLVLYFSVLVMHDRLLRIVFHSNGAAKLSVLCQFGTRLCGNPHVFTWLTPLGMFWNTFFSGSIFTELRSPNLRLDKCQIWVLKALSNWCFHWSDIYSVNMIILSILL